MSVDILRLDKEPTVLCLVYVQAWADFRTLQYLSMLWNILQVIHFSLYAIN